MSMKHLHAMSFMFVALLDFGATEASGESAPAVARAVPGAEAPCDIRAKAREAVERQTCAAPPIALIDLDYWHDSWVATSGAQSLSGPRVVAFVAGPRRYSSSHGVSTSVVPLTGFTVLVDVEDCHAYVVDPCLGDDGEYNAFISALDLDVGLEEAERLFLVYLESVNGRGQLVTDSDQAQWFVMEMLHSRQRTLQRLDKYEKPVAFRRLAKLAREWARGARPALDSIAPATCLDVDDGTFECTVYRIGGAITRDRYSVGRSGLITEISREVLGLPIIMVLNRGADLDSWILSGFEVPPPPPPRRRPWPPR